MPAQIVQVPSTLLLLDFTPPGRYQKIHVDQDMNNVGNLKYPYNLFQKGLIIKYWCN